MTDHRPQIDNILSSLTNCSRHSNKKSQTPSFWQTVLHDGMKSLNHSNRTRFNNLLRVCVGALGAFLLWTYSGWDGNCAPNDPLCHSRHVRSLDTYQGRPLETKVLAHAAGFTVLDNAYWRNHTWYFVTSKKWAFPEIRHVVTNGPWYDEQTRWDDSVARVISPKEALELGLEVNDAEIVDGSSVSLILSVTCLLLSSLRSSSMIKSVSLRIYKMKEHVSQLMNDISSCAFSYYRSRPL